MLVHTFSGHIHGVSSVVFNPIGQQVMTGSLLRFADEALKEIDLKVPGKK